MSCESSDKLSGWAMRLREKLSLYNKVIRGREYHHRRFYGGGDSGHLRYITYLVNCRSGTEVALVAVNQRHDEISGTPYPDSEDRDAEEVAAILGWEASPISEVPTAEDPYADPFEEDQRRERSILIDKLFAFRKVALLHEPDTRAQLIDYMERLVILAIRERSGMRALLRTGAVDVEEFLAQDIVTLDELKQIYVAVHFTPPQAVLRAINDAFRDADDAHDVALGRRIYADAGDGGMCLAAWDLFEDVTPCRHCALQGAHTLEDWTRVERLATLSLRFVCWQPPDVAEFSRADMLFHLSGVFAERKWERQAPTPKKARGGGWVETESLAGLYLKFPLTHTDAYHRFLATLQRLPDDFSVLPWAPSVTRTSNTLIPKARTVLYASRTRSAKRLTHLPAAEWRDAQPLTEHEARALHAAGRDPSVLHMIVLDRAGGSLARLKDNLAAAFAYAQDPELRTGAGAGAGAFVGGAARALLDAGAAPDWGADGAGLLGVACGAIVVPGASFAQFRRRCIALVKTLGDADAAWATRWGRRTRAQKQADALKCWDKWRRRLDRVACSKDLFYLGTEEGHTHLRERLGKTISPTDGALVKYDEDISREVFQHALDRSEAVENMLPPRQIPMDWDGEIEYPDEIIDVSRFTRPEATEESQATIIELVNELPAPLE
ncbi:hypothetical protein FB451DRAFT_1439999 [Mycena latifolia]|nr:hypothetical protein FB451DRAFT_1439999 [Mycena latifolia]